MYVGDEASKFVTDFVLEEHHSRDNLKLFLHKDALSSGRDVSSSRPLNPDGEDVEFSPNAKIEDKALYAGEDSI